MRWEASVAVAATVLFCSAAGEAAAAACSAAPERAGCDGSGMAEAESEQMQIGLMQTRSRILRSRDAGHPAGTASLLMGPAGAALSVEQRASLLVPLAWLHVPKTGTSFVNTLYHTPAVCHDFPAHYFINSSESAEGSWNDAWGNRNEFCEGGFSTSYGPNWLQEGPPLLPPAWGSHVGIGGGKGHFYELNRGHFVTMLRQPEQRLISMYYHYGAVGLFADSLTTRTWMYDSESPSLREYAQWNAGCTVRQLTKDVLFPCQTLPLPTSEDLAVAINVLQDGFAFVGITDQWDLSVCLFRAMFGGQCNSNDFENTRQGNNSSESGYDTSELDGLVDMWDGPLYSEGLQMFESARHLYGVDTDSCASFCQGQ